MDQNKVKEKIKKLTPEQFRITQESGTEIPFTGEYLYNDQKGMYHCIVCGEALFSSDKKFDSGSGWPSFSDVVNSEKVELVPDNSHGMQRTEIRCKNCGAHLGHVFEVGDYTETGQYYCVNSCALDFHKPPQ